MTFLSQILIESLKCTLKGEVVRIQKIEIRFNMLPATREIT
jgi:hypothetical protein